MQVGTEQGICIYRLAHRHPALERVLRVDTVGRKVRGVMEGAGWGGGRRGYTWKRDRTARREGQSGLILRFIQIFGLGLNCAAPG